MSPHFLEACRYAKRRRRSLTFRRRPTASASRSSRSSPTRRRRRGSDLAYFQFSDGVDERREPATATSRTSSTSSRTRSRSERVPPGIAHHPRDHDRQHASTTARSVRSSTSVHQELRPLDGVSFQPVSFTGRDEEISDEDRRRQRYTISHIAHGASQLLRRGKIDPYRDWVPARRDGGSFSALADHLRSLQAPRAQLRRASCSCHPNCGFSVLHRREHARRGAWSTITQFFDLARFMNDIAVDLRQRARNASSASPRSRCPSCATTPTRSKTPLGLDPRSSSRSSSSTGRFVGRWQEDQGAGLANPLGRRDVVPGSLDVRLPSHGDVRHSVRHTRG